MHFIDLTVWLEMLGSRQAECMENVTPSISGACGSCSVSSDTYF